MPIPLFFNRGVFEMIKCEKCNAIFSNEKILHMHMLLCESQVDIEKQEVEKVKTKPKAKRTTAKKKKTTNTKKTTTEEEAK